MRVERRTPARLQWVTLLGALAAHLAFSWAGLNDSRFTWENLSAWLPGVIGTGLGFWGMTRLAKSWPEPPAVSPVFVLLALGSLAADAVSRRMGWPGQPLEAVIIGSMRNVMLGMAATAVWRTYQPLTMLLALFISLFSLTLRAQPATQIAVAVYAVIGVAWLSMTYWSSLDQRLIRRRQFRRPIWLVPGIAAIVLVLILAVTGTGRQSYAALEGWLRSSGGSGQMDSSARGGVGDGEMLVKGEDNIQSFGPLEDAPMVESHQPSLYDVVNELYNEPVRKTSTDRAISLPPQYATQVQQRMSKTERATQEFQTNRRGSSLQRRAKNLTSEALFYVKGRAPLHLRLESFDLFDGDTWYPEAPPEFPDPLIVEQIAGRPWVRSIHAPIPYEFYAQPETHAIKVVRLKTNTIPTPPNLCGVHIDLVDRSDLFRWAAPGQLAMERDSLPSLVAIHLKSRTVYEQRMDREWKSLPEMESPYLVLPEGKVTSRLKKLADDWTADATTPWQRVVKVREQLKQGFQLTCGGSDQTSAEGELDPDNLDESALAEFLFTTRSGPDYLFATAAALLLRTQGIQTRLASGFYAHPDRFDALRKHTPVMKDDVHFWTEVKIAGREWMPLEACPGYEVLAPPPRWWERLLALGWTVLSWSRTNWPLLLGLAFAAAAAWLMRVPLGDGWLTLRWRFFPTRSPRRQVLRTWQLLEQRLRLYGVPRPAGVPPRSWLFTLGLKRESDAAVWELARCGEWAAFCPETVNCPEQETRAHHELCRAAVRTLSSQRIRQISAERRSKTDSKSTSHRPESTTCR